MQSGSLCNRHIHFHLLEQFGYVHCMECAVSLKTGCSVQGHMQAETLPSKMEFD